MFRAAGQVERRPRDVFANARTREVNRQQSERTRVQFTSVEKRLADMDLMGIDIQALTPAPNQTYYETPPDLGIATARAINDNIADIVAPPSGSLRRPGHGAVSGARAGGGRTRAAAQIARAARHRDRHQCRRRGSVSRPLPPDLRQSRGARADDLHAPDRVHRGAAFRRSLLHQRDRQSAGYHGGGASPDLRRRAGGMPETEAGARAWRRLPAGLFGPHRPCRQRASRLLRADHARCRPNI